MNYLLATFLAIMISPVYVQSATNVAYMQVVYEEPYRTEDWYYELETLSGKTRRILETFGNVSVFEDESTDTKIYGTNVYENDKSVHSFNGLVVTIIESKRQRIPNENVMLIGNKRSK